MDDDGLLRDSVGPLLLRSPELAPVLAHIMSAVIDALKSEFGDRTPPSLIRQLRYAAATAITEAYEPIARAASRMARITETNRTNEAASVQKRANDTAALVSATAAALRERHDQLVERVATEAAAAARTAARSAVPGQKLAAKKQAIQEANTVQDAAAARASQRAAAALLTAAAAQQAAIRLTIETEHAAGVVARDALQAATATQATALSIMYEIAIDAVCRYLLVPPPTATTHPLHDPSVTMPISSEIPAAVTLTPTDHPHAYHGPAERSPAT